jgi:hypothetical protein
MMSLPQPCFLAAPITAAHPNAAPLWLGEE